MNIVISNDSDKSIYEQIVGALKAQILDGTLKSDEILPSIRSLARDLKISVITTKKAYEILENDGYIYVIAGKGCYVKGKSKELLKEEILKNIENDLNKVINTSIKYNISKKEILEIIDILYEEDK